MHRYLKPYSLATYAILLFCTAHTIGGVLLTPSFGPAGDAVFASMVAVHFDFMGSDRTFNDFRVGSGLMASVFLLLTAALSWHLGRVPQNPALRPVAWALFTSYVPILWLSWQYFFTGPVIMSSIVLTLFGWECMTTYA